MEGAGSIPATASIYLFKRTNMNNINPLNHNQVVTLNQEACKLGMAMRYARYLVAMSLGAYAAETIAAVAVYRCNLEGALAEMAEKNWVYQKGGGWFLSLEGRELASKLNQSIEEVVA